jgi:hypothetical protein
MNKLVVIISIVFINFNYGSCQALYKEKKETIEYQNTLFLTSDTIYHFSRVIDESGYFSFMGYFMSDTIISGYSHIFKKDTTIKYTNSYVKLSNKIDTINSIVPVYDINYNKLSQINIRDEIKFSYILKKLREPRIDSSENKMIRVLYPCSKINTCKSYNLIKIIFFGDSAKIYTKYGTSEELTGFKIKRNESSILRQRDQRKIKRRLEGIKKDINECRRPGNPFLFECNISGDYYRIIASKYCIKDKKELKKLYRFIGLLRRISVSKYFEYQCMHKKNSIK